MINRYTNCIMELFLSFADETPQPSTMEGAPVPVPSFYNMYFDPASKMYQKYVVLCASFQLKDFPEDCVRERMKRVQSVEPYRTEFEQLIKKKCDEEIHNNRLHRDVKFLYQRWFVQICILKACSDLDAYLDQMILELSKFISRYVLKKLKIYSVEREAVLPVETEPIFGEDETTTAQEQQRVLRSLKSNLKVLVAYLSFINSFIFFIVREVPETKNIKDLMAAKTDYLRQGRNLVSLATPLRGKKFPDPAAAPDEIKLSRYPTSVLDNVLTTPFLDQMLSEIMALIEFPDLSNHAILAASTTDKKMRFKATDMILSYKSGVNLDLPAPLRTASRVPPLPSFLAKLAGITFDASTMPFDEKFVIGTPSSTPVPTLTIPEALNPPTSSNYDFSPPPYDASAYM